MGDAAGFSSALGKKRQLILLMVLAVLVLHVSVHAAYHHHLASKGHTFQHAGEPLLTSADGYFYLDIAKRMAEEANPGFSSKERRGAGLMTAVAVDLHELTGISLPKVAFYLPPVIALFMIPALLMWGAAIKRLEVGIIGAALLSLSPYWFLRTRVGFFDTDSLIPFLALMGPLCMMGFVSHTTARRYMYLLGGACVAVAGYFWWPQVKFFGLIVTLTAYLCSVVLPSSRVERYIKIALLALLAAIAVMALAGINIPGAKDLSAHVQSLARHVRLIFLQGGDAVLPGARVGELNSMDSLWSLKIVNGSYIGVAAAIIGIALFYAKQWTKALFLLPVVGMGVLTIAAARFAIFFLPVYALGVGYLCSEAYRSKAVSDILPKAWHRALFATILVVSIAVPSSLVVYTLHLNPAYNSTQAGMAARAGDVTAPGTLLWSTWSKGYFLKYYSRRPVYSDGGTLSPEHLYISESPLAVDSPRLAANWLRFFAKRKIGGLRRIARQLGVSETQAVVPLKSILASENPDELLTQLGFTPVEKWRKYFFPNARVALYLDHIMLRNAPGWFKRGTWDMETRRGLEGEAVRFNGGGMPIESFLDGLRLGGGVKTAGRIITVDGKGAHERVVYPARTGTLVEMKGEPHYYYLGPKFEQSLFYSLYFKAPDHTPHFKKLFHEPRHAGLWLVE